MKTKITSVALALLVALKITGVTSVSAQETQKYKWVRGEKFLLHKVTAKETWSGLARKYQVDVNEVIKANPGVVDLKVGQIVNIPVNTESPVDHSKTGTPAPPAPESPTAGQSAAVYYVVKHGETLFSIALKSNTTVENIRKWNGISGNNIKAGQKIIVGYVSDIKPLTASESPADSKPETPKTENSQPANASGIKMTAAGTIQTEKPAADKNLTSPPTHKQSHASTESRTLLASAAQPLLSLPEPTFTSKEISKSGNKVLSQVSETGICAWITDNDNMTSRYYALHRTAPVGTIMKVTNKMNGKSVYVKVVGTLPETGDNDKIIIKISESAVKRMGALDDFFQVELSYGLMK